MKRINVTEPFLPPLEEYVEYLKGIWDRNWLTNQGPLVRELEHKLEAYHQLPFPVRCVANGSLGLQIILKALGVKGEVITTPFSYVATTSCPLWEGCSVKFADIEPDHLTIDPVAVEAAITPQTEAILATHVFGNPCDVEALDAIAAKHGIAMIYDAAHAFGVTYKGKSILEYGDASMVSLHATKLFHAVEGGFIVAKDPAISEKMEWMRRFGHKGQDEFHGVGLNAKMSELHAAMGLCNLKHTASVLQQREHLCCAYDDLFLGDLATSDSPSVAGKCYREGASRSASYYPLVFETESSLLSALQACRDANVFPRRYFYPDLSSCFSQASNVCPLSMDVSRRILCLPLSSSLTTEQARTVATLIYQSSHET